MCQQSSKQTEHLQTATACELQAASKEGFGCTFMYSTALAGSVCCGLCVRPPLTQLGSWLRWMFLKFNNEPCKRWFFKNIFPKSINLRVNEQCWATQCVSPLPFLKGNHRDLCFSVGILLLLWDPGLVWFILSFLEAFCTFTLRSFLKWSTGSGFIQQLGSSFLGSQINWGWMGPLQVI